MRCVAPLGMVKHAKHGTVKGLILAYAWIAAVFAAL